MSLCGAQHGYLAVKEKYRELGKEIQECCREPELSLHPLPDVYPAGDEFVLVHLVLGKVIPPGGLPLHVGCIVNNPETFLNIARQQPVITKFLTVGGAVKTPVTLEVPVGISFAECLNAAGGPTVPKFALLSGGVMMGKLEEDLSRPVTRTTGGLLVFPEDHEVPRRYRRPWREVEKIGRAACDQCVFCTELCPRYLLGHPIQPHISMRALLFSPRDESYLTHNYFCCECNLCSLVSCPENLDPKSTCVEFKGRARRLELTWKGSWRGQAHPLIAERRTPLARLFTKLGLHTFSNHAPLRSGVLETGRIVLPLKPPLGAPASPLVRQGKKVKRGELVAAPPSQALGVPVYSSIDGQVVSVDSATIVIEA